MTLTESKVHFNQGETACTLCGYPLYSGDTVYKDKLDQDFCGRGCAFKFKQAETERIHKNKTT